MERFRLILDLETESVPDLEEALREHFEEEMGLKTGGRSVQALLSEFIIGQALSNAEFDHIPIKLINGVIGDPTE